MRHFIVTFFCIFCLASCEHGLPEKSYQWNKTLKSTKGQIGPLIDKLPLGSLFYLEEKHPLAEKKKNDKLVFSNAKRLVPFLNPPDSKQNSEIFSRALAVYSNSLTEASGAVQGVLWKKDLNPSILNKEKTASSIPGLLNTKMIRFHIRQAKLISASGIKTTESQQNCRFYQVNGPKDYLLLSAYKRNLHLEIAVSGSLPIKKEARKPGEGPISFLFLNDYRKTPVLKNYKKEPVFEKLKKIYERIGLSICPLLNK
jgi:hypothetical protein